MTDRYVMPTDTAHINIQSRQYEIFNYDLGEGVDRLKLVVGGAITVGWLFLVLLAGVPLFTKYGFAVYGIPPALITVLATRTDAGGRPMYALWWDKCRFLLRRRQVMVPRASKAASNTVSFITTPEFTVIDTAQYGTEKGGRK